MAVQGVAMVAQVAAQEEQEAIVAGWEATRATMVAATSMEA